MLPTLTPLALIAATLLVGCGLDPNAPGHLVPATVDDDPDLPALTLAGTRLHVREVGPADAPVIVVLHGGPGDDARYMLRLAERHNGRALTDDHRLIFWDQRGSGLSRRHPADELSIALMLDDLRQLVEHYAPGPEKVILLGHSWGGQYATAFLDRHPDKVAGAILLEPGELTAELDRKHEDAVVLGLDAEWINDWMWGRQALTLDDHAEMDYYLAVGSRGAQPSRTNEETSPWWRFGALVKKVIYLDEIGDRGYDFATDLSDVTIPVLVIAGEGQDLSADLQREQLALFPDARLAVVPGAGHTDIVWARVDESLVHIFAYLDALDTDGGTR